MGVWTVRCDGPILDGRRRPNSPEDEMPFQTLSLEIDGHVAVVTIGRTGVPQSGNLIDEPSAAELSEAVRQVEENDDIRVLVLTGAGDAFCGGTDPAALGGCGDVRETLRGLRVAGKIARVGRPTIAAINGDALGQGLELALACDLRVASAGVRLAMPQLREGLIPWDGGTQRLPRLVGLGRAMELVLTSREIDAEEALAMGMVSCVVGVGEALPQALEIARSIAGHGPIATRYLKEAVLKGMDMTLEQGLAMEADIGLLLHRTSDRAEGISSFLERRTPHYKGA